MHYQHARVFDWQHVCYVWWTCFSTESLHTYGYKLCSSSRRQGFTHKKGKETRPIRYIDDILSLNNSRLGDFVELIYPIELEIKDTTYIDRSASYLDLQLEIDSEGRLRTELCDKRDDFNFLIVNFTFICSNIPAAPAYGINISQLIRYSRVCGFNKDHLPQLQ